MAIYTPNEEVQDCAFEQIVDMLPTATMQMHGVVAVEHASSYSSSTTNTTLAQPHASSYVSSPAHSVPIFTHNFKSAQRPAPTLRSRNTRSTPSDMEWNHHREQIIQLYWDHDLTIHQVQEYMKQARGFDKSIKAYKGRLKRWGIRKNIKKEEAVQLASGQAVLKFWPDERIEGYQRRVARHISNQRIEPTTSAWKQARMLREGPSIPAQLYTRDILEAVESALFYGDIFLQGIRQPRTVTMITNPSVKSDERFFSLFEQSIENIAQDHQPHLAFAKLNTAFDHLKGLLMADHPIVYYRLASQILSCKAYPNSAVVRKVCRLLAVHLSQLASLVMGPGHPINHWWSTGIKLLDSGRWDHVERFLESAQRLGSKYIAYVPGTVDLITYIPSEFRGQRDDMLREKIEELSLDSQRVSEAQEARLCLSELLLGQGNVDEGLQVLREAVAVRSLDLSRPAGKAFWMSELLWRAGEVNDSLSMLEEAKELVKKEDGVARAPFLPELDEMLRPQPQGGLLLKREALEGTGLGEAFLLSLIMPKVYQARLGGVAEALRGSVGS